MNAIYAHHSVKTASIDAPGFIPDAEVPGWRNKV